ncbi:HAD family hydrolase [Pseudomonas parasichuanensis]|uniref:HAD family hydrolase n=1 Tax=Pseudomonas parasichuanensis TaxID=2892329 RepID=UPI001F29223F|nr:HAD family hydrolase [Pseudomonas parasichuanensis]
MIDLGHYKTIVFDCDGVILDSNKIKTDAFYQAALPYGHEAAKRLVEYHQRNGGISRFKKFEYLLSHLVAADAEGPGLDELLRCYATEVASGLMNCAVADGLLELRAQYPATRWMVASGGAQCELREVFEARGLAPLFDGGIFGSPDTKEVIVARELVAGNLQLPALFLGDSRYDHVAASQFELDFVFVSKWSEFDGWEVYCRDNGLPNIEAVSSLADFA